MSKVIAEIPNAILLVVDPTHNETVVPEYDPDHVASAKDTYVSFATQSPEDGEVEVS